MATRIHWTDEERQQVLEKAVEVYHRGGVGYVDALRTAQNLTLPTHRLRNMATHSAISPEVKLLKAMVVNAPIAKKVVTPRPSLQVQPEPPVAQPVGLDNATMEDLVAEIAKRFASRLAEAVTHEIKELEHSFKLQKHDPSYASSGIFKKRIVIVGLHQDQQRHIIQEYDGKFAIRFIDVDDARHADIPEAEAYLLIKNFISHVVFERYQKKPQHVIIDGGMTTLRAWLNTKGAEL